MHSDFYSRLSDEELFALVRRDDAGAYKEIYERFFGLLYVHAYKKLQDKEEARDTVQEVFSALWNKRHELLLTGNLSGYLYASVRNRILNFLARSKVQGAYLATLSAEQNASAHSTDYRVRERELKRAIEREVAALPPKMREVFELSRVHYLSHKEIAERMEISDKTVKRQISNALKLLKTKLGLLLLFGMHLF